VVKDEKNSSAVNLRNICTLTLQQYTDHEHSNHTTLEPIDMGFLLRSLTMSPVWDVLAVRKLGVTIRTLPTTAAPLNTHSLTENCDTQLRTPTLDILR
jgi:hypothetical protein